MHPESNAISWYIIQMKATEQKFPVVQFIMSWKAITLNLVFTDSSNFSIVSKGERRNEVNPMWSTNLWDKARSQNREVRATLPISMRAL